MKARRAFTVLELLVGIVIAGVVALLVYGAAGAAADVQEKLAEQRDARQAVTGIRETIAAALRNARPALSNRDTVFALENRRNATGRPMARLSFVAAGALPPLTPDADWSVTLDVTPSGLVLSASPIGFSSFEHVMTNVPGITGVEIRARAPASQSWVSAWNDRTKLPAAVELTFWADTGVVGRSIYIVVPAGGVP